MSLNMNEIVSRLVQECESNPAYNAVFHVFALRKRTRNVIKINSLYYAMKKEGFNYDRLEYVKFIQMLSSLGLGTLEIDAKGHIRGLKSIRVTLQSLGAVACKQTTSMKSFVQRNKFIKIISSQTEVEGNKKPPTAVISVEEQDKKAAKSSAIADLHLYVNGKDVKIVIPSEFTTKEVIDLVNKLHYN